MRGRSYFSLWGTLGELKGTTGIKTVQDVMSDSIFGIFEFCTVVGLSFFLTLVLWKGLSKIEVKDPDKKILKPLVDITIFLIVLFAFEGFIILIEYIFAIVVKGYSLPTSLTVINYSGYNITFNEIIDAIVKLTWIDLVLIGFFYTVIGFEAFRIAKQYENLIKRISLDFAQGILFLLEFFLLFLPFGVGQYMLVDNVILLLYWLFIVVLFFESLWLVNHQIEVEKEKSGQDSNLNTFMILMVGIFFSLSLLITALPLPFILFFMNPLVFVLILAFLFFGSFCIVVLIYLSTKIGISTSLIERIDYGTRNIRFTINAFMASKGTVFNYPAPTNIIGDDQSPGESISSKMGKVKLKIACGRCFHVFIVETVSQASKIRTFACPFCGSMATTPVWE